MSKNSLKILCILLCVSSLGFSSDPKDTMKMIGNLNLADKIQIGSVNNSYDDGFIVGKNQAISSHSLYGLYEKNSSISSIVAKLYFDQNETYYNSGYEEGFNEANKSVYSNPSEYNLLNVKDFDKSVTDILDQKVVSSLPYTKDWFYVPQRGWLFTNNSIFPWFYEPNSNDFMVLDSFDGNASFYHPKYRNWISVIEEEIVLSPYQLNKNKSRIKLKAINKSQKESLEESGLPDSLISSIANNNPDFYKSNNYSLYEVIGLKILEASIAPSAYSMKKSIGFDKINNTSGKNKEALNPNAGVNYGENYLKGVEDGKSEVSSNYQKYGFAKLSDIQDEIDKELAIKYSEWTKAGKAKGFSDGIASVVEDDTNFMSKEYLSDFKLIKEVKDSFYTNGWFFQSEIGWRWTDESTFPFIFDQTTGEWLYFKSDSKKSLFYQYDSKSWKNIE